VRSGDTLSAIASRHGTTVAAIMSANPQISDPNSIFPGDGLTLPGGSTSSAPAASAPAASSALPGPTATADFQMTAPRRAQYLPFSTEAEMLFADACRFAGLPASWATAPGVHHILDAESDGKVGIPNYTYGARKTDTSRWPEVHDELKRGIKSVTSSATGLGQLILANVDAYYPSGRGGIGDALEEAVGMLKYIQSRYGSPQAAWAAYDGGY
jgi:murein DD-endopeptidase MepM/ murein hydrolase activator NlpD